MVKEEKIRNAVILSAMGSDAATCVVARTRFPLHSAAFGGIDVSRGDYRKEFNARQINITPAGATELTGKHLHVTTGAGLQSDFFCSLSSAPANIAPAVFPLLPLTTYTNVAWDRPTQTVTKSTTRENMSVLHAGHYPT
jgi:hypothetical protein